MQSVYSTAPTNWAKRYRALFFCSDAVGVLCSRSRLGKFEKDMNPTISHAFLFPVEGLGMNQHLIRMWDFPSPKWFTISQLKSTVCPVLPDNIGVLCTVTKELVRGLEGLEIRGRVEIIHTAALLTSARILRRVQETLGDLLSLRLQWKTIS